MDPSASLPRTRVWPTSLVAVAVTAVVVTWLIASARGRLATTFGDTDDAMRLVMVREFLSGTTGWFTPHMTRVQPPAGADMHWSRLVDGGLAAMYRAFDLFLAPAQAEAAMRLAWPLLWIFPATWAALALSRRLGGTAALLPAAALLTTNVLLYAQWWPGRIDHHDIQITMALAAAAGAAYGGVGGGMLAGVASAFGLAVGIEVLPFTALAGASFALRFALDPEARARPAQAYGVTLAVATSVFYLAQTPPAQLAATHCDAIGSNLWAGVVLAGLALATAVQVTRGRSVATRWIGLVVAGALAGAVYVGLDPACLRGPAGHVDPRIRPIWMDLVTEMFPLLHKFWTTRSNFVACCLVFMAFGALSWLWLGARAARTHAWLLAGAFMALSAALGLSAQRMAHYANWFAVPLMAAALSDITQRYFKGHLLAPVLIVVATCQPIQIALFEAIPGWSKRETRAERAADRCVEQPAMRPLADLPDGLVLGEIDLGPRILAQTRHSVVAAPYHRMNLGILGANTALAATPGADEAAARALKADYVVTCPARIGQMNHAGMGRMSLQVRLDRGEAPAWLQPLSAPKAPLQIYRVRPPSLAPEHGATRPKVLSSD